MKPLSTTSESRSGKPDVIGPAGRLLFGAYVAAIGLSVFLLPTYWSTNLTFIFDPHAPASRDGQALRVHWIVPIAGLVVVYLAWRQIRGHRIVHVPRGNVVLAFVLILCAALVVGLIRGGGLLNVVYFAQTIIPIVGFFVGAHAGSRLADVRKLLGVLVVSTTVGVLAILALGARYDTFSQGIVASNLLARAVPQVRDYFPFVVVTSLALAWVSLLESAGRQRRLQATTIVTILVLFYAVVWSRMALVMLLIVLVAPLLLRSRRHSWRRLGYRVPIAVVALFGLALLLSQFGQLQARWERGDFEQSNDRRIGYAVQAMEIIGAQPWFGRGFAADWTRDPHPERDLRIPRVFKSHNQYLDYGVRAGVFAVALLALLAVLVAVDLRETLRRTRGDRVAQATCIAIASALAALVVGNSTQLLLVQAQTGSLAWFLAGVAARLAANERGSPEPGGSPSVATETKAP